MVGMAIQDNPCFELCDAEMRMEGPSYTVETLKVLAESTVRKTGYAYHWSRFTGSVHWMEAV